jgi:hypothetical protein
MSNMKFHTQGKGEQMNAVTKTEPRETLLPADPMVSMIERIAMDPSSDLDKLERMMAMKERLEADAAKKAYASAFSVMQSQLPIIPERGKIKNKNGDVQSTYPLWEDVIAALRKPLADNGLSMSFDRRREDQRTFFGCIVTHEQGHSQRAEIDLPRDDSGSKNAVQGEGSTVSYGQRYSSKMLINWTSEGSEDDDGVAAAAANTVSAEQYVTLRDLIAETGTDEQKFHLAFGHKDPANADLKLFPAARFSEAKSMLLRKKENK